MRANILMPLVCLVVLAAGCAHVHRESRSARLYRFHQARMARLRWLQKQREARLDPAIELVADLKYKEAAVKLEPLMAVFAEAGSAAYAAESAFWLGYCREKLGDPNEARKLYDLVARKYPATPAARQAIARMTRLK